jgi:hypothetical protein
MYRSCFYLMLMFYFYNSITGNNEMVNSSFQGLVILGLLALFNNK